MMSAEGSVDESMQNQQKQDINHLTQYQDDKDKNQISQYELDLEEKFEMQDIENGLFQAGEVMSLPWIKVPLLFKDKVTLELSKIANLKPEIKAQLLNCNFDSLFPIQTAVWQYTGGGLLLENDFCICAQTGSGKTLAYILPILNRIQRLNIKGFTALILAPNRDLVIQIYNVCKSICDGLNITVCNLGGQGTEFEETGLLRDIQNCQIDLLQLIISTPGRFVAHFNKGNISNLSNIQFLVLDESDFILKQSNTFWLQQLLDIISTHLNSEQARNNIIGKPCTRVTKFLVSATVSRDPAKLQHLHLYNPRYITIQSAQDQRFRLPSQLKVVEYTSGLAQAQRSKNLKRIQEGDAKIIVATNSLTRGHDVLSLSIVINFDLPSTSKLYLHRAGRTARAGTYSSATYLEIFGICKS